MSDQDEEYHEEGSAASARQAGYSNSNHPLRRILVMLAVVMTFLFAYKFLTLLATKSKVSPASTVSSKTEETSIAKIEDNKMAELNSVLSKKEHDFEEKTEEFQKKIEQLQAQSNESNQQLQSMGSVLQKIQSQLELQQQEVQKQQENWMKMQQEKMAVKKHSSVEPVKKPSYFVRALIPNRAWLEDLAGSVITVSPGQEIKGHGTVTRIDVGSGEVQTSTFSVFTFPPDVR